ncbi:MAG: TRAP transporter substrate-binding protein [Candidatus Eisenbacteria bacterium]|uniref:TRAP transporter substrate-binding protein n=1 Tax=Eiseniibacteriota bacterium TaxID=2212470 RepID=A0A956LXC8_UNCEI|nr:TRAP transporter substrate-binding protein [Candidatus Eisenbacteria bacterium]
MKRRDFVNRALPAALTAVAGCGGRESGGAAQDAPNVRTEQNVRWTLCSSFPAALDTIYGSSTVLAERVEALSDGRFTIRVYEPGEIVPALQVMDAVQQGTAQVGQTASYYFIGKNPALAFDTCVPFGMSSRQQSAWLYEGGGLELVQELFADFGIVTFPAGNTGAQMGGWFQREIHSAADLRGLKIRIPGIGGEVMSRLGATVQNLAGGEIYQALERGAIDAAEWVGPYDDEKLGFHQVAKYYYYPGWWEPGPSLSFYVNRDAWTKLPKSYQEIFRTAAFEAAATMQARYDARNPAALQRLLAAGVQLRSFSDDVMEAARAQARAYCEENAAKQPDYRKVYQAWDKARQEMFDWFGTAELAYARFAFSGARSSTR